MQLGDSLTAQSEARQFLYDKLVAAGDSFEFVGSQGATPLLHEGHSGFTIGPDASLYGNLSDNIETWIPQAQPDIVTLLIGNNDYNVLNESNAAGAPQRMMDLLDQISLLAPNATIIVSSVLKIAWVDDYAAPLNLALPGIVADQQARGHAVYFANLHNEVDLIKGAFPYNGSDGDYVDGTHLNTSGAIKLADGWYNHLQPFLAIPEPSSMSLIVLSFVGLLLTGRIVLRRSQRASHIR